jgi:hypothetical protein
VSGPTVHSSRRRFAARLNSGVRGQSVTVLPPELIAYHRSGKPLRCEIPVQPWGCEFWPLDEVFEYNKKYMVSEFAPGYLGFASSGGGEMYTFAPSGRIVCLAFAGISPKEELPVAETWQDFESMLANAR